MTPTAHARTATWFPVRCYRLEAKYEFLKLLRMPGYALPAVAFPVMFYALFGLSFGGRVGNTTMATYLIATYGAFGVIGAALFGFGLGIAIERGQGWMTLKRATPMPPMAYFVAKLTMSLLFAAIITALLIALGTMFGGVRQAPSAWLRLAGTLIGGALPFCALGLAIGYFVGPNGAAPLVNLVYLPMGFASGLWIPIEALPRAMQSIAVSLPPYHLGQLALSAVGSGRGGPAWAHLSVLAGFTLVGLALALWGYRRDEDKTWG
jgi:ABC-2 type transport system permease protein